MTMVAGRTFASADRRALLASLTLHALALALVLAVARRDLLLGVTPQGAPPVIALAQRVALERRLIAALARPVPTALPPARARPVPRAHAPVALARVWTAPEARRPAAGSRTAHAAARPATMAAKAPDAAATAAPAAVAVQHPALSATAPPTPAPAPAGGFAQNHPAIFWDFHAFDDLRARLGTFAIVIDVDETGRARSIEFARPLADPALRDEVVARLMAARYIPAQCDGLDCPGEVDFRS